MPESITIVTDDFRNRIEGTKYLVAQLARVWESQGIKVQVTAGCNYIPADIAILHVDRTVVPDEYLELGARYPVVLNGQVKDILKTSISRNLLKKDDSYTGPVIVKTNANYGGVNEFLINSASVNSTLPPSFIDRPWRKREVMDSLTYPVFDRLADVPPGVWKNNKLVVEKFIPERLENGDYKCRFYYFLGEQEFAVWYRSPKPVVKSVVSTSMGVIEQIPPALTDLRRASGFNYGKFDYTEVNGEISVNDMNKTPTVGAQVLSLMSDEKLNALANEIYSF